MSEVPETRAFGDNGSTLVRLTSAHSAEGAMGTFVPISVELWRKASEAWMKKFQLRKSAGIVDEDHDLWVNGYLKDYCTAADPPFGYAVVAADEVQGIVLFDMALHRSRTTTGVQVLYVQYLATAPWNRKAGVRSGKFGRVGRALVKQAVRESIRCGSPGRVGIHSIVNSVPFFEKLSFENLGTDPQEPDLIYFELRPVRAFSVLTNQECRG